MKRSLMIAAGALALLAATPALAQRGPGPGPGGHGGPFGLLMDDANADGRITRAEFDTAQRKAFADLDANKDGSATPEEIRAGREKQMQAKHTARIMEMDTDKNGQVSKAEIDAFQAKQSADRAERRDDRQAGMRGEGRGPGPMGRMGPGMMRQGGMGPMAQMGRGGPQGGPAGGPGGQPPQGQPAPGVQRAGPADADGDGKLTFAEFAKRRTEMFDKADADKNNTVTIAELQSLAR